MDARADKVKSSKAELDLVLETVIEMIIKGHTRTDIIRHFQKDENKINAKSERSVDYYISNAREEIKKRFEPQKEALIALAVMRYEDLYKKNYQIQDFRECRSVQDSLNKITGISVDKTELTIREQPLFNE